jgi:hypothetical protein
MKEKIRNVFSGNNLSARRTFLKLAGLTSLVTVLPTFKTKAAHARYVANRNWWYTRDVFSTSENTSKSAEYCVQHNLNTDSASDGILWSNIDNRWRKYPIRQLSDDFMKWGCSERHFYYDERLDTGGEGPPTVMKNGGIHHGMVASYGNWKGRGDSAFNINIAVKGTALCPSRETILELLPVLEQLKIDDPPDRITQYYEIMRGIYSDISNFDKTKLVTLELFTQQTDGPLYDAGYKETHTFANMMANPICSIGFLQQEHPQKNYFDPNGSGGYNDFEYGIHYEVRTIPKVLHCWAPAMGNEYDVFKYQDAEDSDAIFGYWVNFLHTFYHGGRANVTAVVHNVIEQFFNYPYDGIRVVPSLG